MKEFGRGLGALIVLVISAVVVSFTIALLWSLAEYWRALFGWG